MVLMKLHMQVLQCFLIPRDHWKKPSSTVQALPMYAQVDKTKKTSNKGGAAQVRVKDFQTFALKVT